MLCFKAKRLKLDQTDDDFNYGVVPADSGRGRHNLRSRATKTYVEPSEDVQLELAIANSIATSKKKVPLTTPQRQDFADYSDFEDLFTYKSHIDIPVRMEVTNSQPCFLLVPSFNFCACFRTISVSIDVSWLQTLSLTFICNISTTRNWLKSLGRRFTSSVPSSTQYTQPTAITKAGKMNLSKLCRHRKSATRKFKACLQTTSTFSTKTFSCFLVWTTNIGSWWLSVSRDWVELRKFP